MAAATKKDPKVSVTGKVLGIRIRSTGKLGFRRLGINFTPEGEVFPLDRFTEEQLAVLKDERMLAITGCEIDADDAPIGEGEQ